MTLAPSFCAGTAMLTVVLCAWVGEEGLYLHWIVIPPVIDFPAPSQGRSAQHDPQEVSGACPAPYFQLPLIFHSHGFAFFLTALRILGLRWCKMQLFLIFAKYCLYTFLFARKLKQLNHSYFVHPKVEPVPCFLEVKT